MAARGEAGFDEEAEDGLLNMKRMLFSGVACPELLLEEEEEKERKEPLLSDFREEVLEDLLLDLSDGPKTNSEKSEGHL